MPKTLYGILILGSLLSLPRGEAQAIPSFVSRELDLPVTYNELYRNTTSPKQFWQEGGTVGLSGDFAPHWGAAMSITGEHASKVAGGSFDLSTVTTVFGPRYTVVHNRTALYGETLIGESHGFDSYFPNKNGATDSFDTFALEIGGGVDLRLRPRIAIRALQINWLRTNFPNATTNVQNSLQFGGGIVFRLARGGVPTSRF
jgi:hypothetical protein